MNTMKSEEINRLLERYNSGNASEQDRVQIEQLLEKNIIQLDDLHDLHTISEQLERIEFPAPSPELDVQFYQMLAGEKRLHERQSTKSWFTFPSLSPVFAFASVTFIAGILLGYFLIRPAASSTEQIQVLTTEINGLREMVMLSLLEKESATDRLKAVSLSQEMREVSSSVTRALITTLNNDPNVNVRLAALDALVPYVSDSNVRTDLIKSITVQESPLVQLALADVMAALQEKSSVKEFRRLLDDDRTPEEVKARIREKINIII